MSDNRICTIAGVSKPYCDTSVETAYCCFIIVDRSSGKPPLHQFMGKRLAYFAGKVEAIVSNICGLGVGGGLEVHSPSL